MKYFVFRKIKFIKREVSHSAESIIKYPTTFVTMTTGSAEKPVVVRRGTYDSTISR